MARPLKVAVQMDPIESINIDGVVFVRGQVVPVVNLRARFNFERAPRDIKTRLMVIAHSDRSVGLLVDSAREFITLREDAIKPTPDAITTLSGRYLAGIANVDQRLVLILDVAEVLNFQDAAPTATLS